MLCLVAHEVSWPISKQIGIFVAAVFSISFSNRETPMWTTSQNLLALMESLSNGALGYLHRAELFSLRRRLAKIYATKNIPLSAGRLKMFSSCVDSTFIAVYDIDKEAGIHQFSPYAIWLFATCGILIVVLPFYIFYIYKQSTIQRAAMNNFKYTLLDVSIVWRKIIGDHSGEPRDRSLLLSVSW